MIVASSAVLLACIEYIRYCLSSNRNSMVNISSAKTPIIYFSYDNKPLSWLEFQNNRSFLGKKSLHIVGEVYYYILYYNL